MLKSLKDPKNQPKNKEEAYLIIRGFIEKENDLALREMLSKDSFTLPSWSEHQAYLLGVLKALDKLKQFIPDQGK